VYRTELAPQVYHQNTNSFSTQNAEKQAYLVPTLGYALHIIISITIAPDVFCKADASVQLRLKNIALVQKQLASNLFEQSDFQRSTESS